MTRGQMLSHLQCCSSSGCSSSGPCTVKPISFSNLSASVLELQRERERKRGRRINEGSPCSTFFSCSYRTKKGFIQPVTTGLAAAMATFSFCRCMGSSCERRSAPTPMRMRAKEADRRTRCCQSTSACSRGKAELRGEKEKIRELTWYLCLLVELRLFPMPLRVACAKLTIVELKQH